MIAPDIETRVSQPLLPHQAALVEMVLDPAGKRVTLVRADVGLGKSTAIVALSKRVLEMQPAARILILAPRAEQMQFAERLNEQGLAALIVDRYLFRSMLDSSSGNDGVWPSGSVILLSLDLARQPDVRDCLMKAHWKIMVANEVPMSGGVRSETLKRVGASADRILITTETIPYYTDKDGPNPENRSLPFPAEQIAIVDWRREGVVDNAGRLLDTAPRPRISETPYELAPEELRLWRLVTEIGRAHEQRLPEESFVKRSLFRHLESSPPAVESLLRRLSEQTSAKRKLHKLAESPDEERTDEGAIPEVALSNAANDIDDVLTYLDQLSIDSKLSAAGDLLEQLLDKDNQTRVCILTDYLATLFYLAAELEARDIKYVLLHGGMSIEDRAHALASLSDPGPVLVATRASLPDNINLSKSTDLIFYDIPKSNIGLERALRRIDRFGRTIQLSVHVIVPSNFADAMLFEQLTSLHNLTRMDAKN